MNEKVKGNCDRCCQSHKNLTTMSIFNEETICLPCKSEERIHPDYKKASDAEIAECKKGNYNFKGIGLPADLKLKYQKEEDHLINILFTSESDEQLMREFEGEN
jgi:hypothetical protein